MNIKDIFGKKMLIMDGAMGTQLQAHGLKAGELPEVWNITNSKAVAQIHESYLQAGCDIILSNTFGANSLKYDGANYPLEQIVKNGVSIAKELALKYSTADKPRFVALDLGPTGKLLKPVGDLEFEKCVKIYAEVIKAGAKYADLILIETMSDTLETKAAILAAKENSNLPVFASMMFDTDGYLLSGADIKCAVIMLEALGVDAIGVNCGAGPFEMMKTVETVLKFSSKPVFASPNAGLPVSVNGITSYDVDENSFAQAMKNIAEKGAWSIGGCCGTTPLHMKHVADLCKEIVPQKVVRKTKTFATSFSKTIEIGAKPIVIGERINPTGKSRFKKALIENDMGYILNEAILQEQNGADVLDVNVGLPDIDEPVMLKKAVEEIQAVSSLVLQIDTSDEKALEAALRVYNGKPIINSVNGKKESMQKVFALAKKYGGVVVGLTLDENGIPETSQGRVKIAKNIIDTAATFGIDKKDILIDALTLTISTGAQNASVTLETLQMLKTQLNVSTVLGVSNVSFGLPMRDKINSAFLTLALNAGLSAAIINPLSPEMMSAFNAFCAIFGLDENCVNYIAAYAGATSQPIAQISENSLEFCVENGLYEGAVKAAKACLINEMPLDIIENRLMPVLDKVGKGFEEKTVFLPTLMMCAKAAKGAFDVVGEHMLKSGASREKGQKIIIATVKGDVHDIGKNIVKVLLENYGFDVFDLGKDVAPEIVLNKVLETGAKVVGLSALMTTTVASMQQTIEMIKKQAPTCKIIAGGAVLNEEYAATIGADYYAKNAMDTVNYAKQNA